MSHMFGQRTIVNEMFYFYKRLRGYRATCSFSNMCWWPSNSHASDACFWFVYSFFFFCYRIGRDVLTRCYYKNGFRWIHATKDRRGYSWYQLTVKIQGNFYQVLFQNNYLSSLYRKCLQCVADIVSGFKSPYHECPFNSKPRNTVAIIKKSERHTMQWCPD